jgi:thiol-disulfide isomerase/thioredoxin
MKKDNRLSRYFEYSVLIIFLSVLTYFPSFSQGEIRTLEIGDRAPGFNLPGVDDKVYSLSDFDEYKVLVVIFNTNHCPTAQSYEDRIISFVNEYGKKGVGFVCISPSDPLAVRINELGFTDLGDDLNDMKIRAADKGFNFPYLYDGETQQASRAYGPKATPHVFIFDHDRNLQYTGRIDDSEAGVTDITQHDTKNALDALLSGNPVPVQTTKTFGCSVKWSDKREAVRVFNEKLSLEPVTLQLINIDQAKDLIKNPSGKLRLINIWATWCGPCVAEFPDFVTINRMYRGRNFEFISISLDAPTKQEEVLSFLKKMEASNVNYLYDSINKYPFIEAIDENWQGPIPYTLLLDPEGQYCIFKTGRNRSVDNEAYDCKYTW